MKRKVLFLIINTLFLSGKFNEVKYACINDILLLTTLLNMQIYEAWKSTMIKKCETFLGEHISLGSNKLQKFLEKLV